MNYRRNGFTIPELLIVIAVIGILAGIAIVAWGGVTNSMHDKARETDTRNWAGAFDVYKGRFIVYPTIPTADGAANAIYQCLGDFASTSSKCGKYTSSIAGEYLNASDAASIITEVAKTGARPNNAGPAISNTFIGPFVWMSQTTGGTGDRTITAYFINYFTGSCPSDFENLTSTSDTKLAKLFNGLTSTSNSKACGLKKTLVYNPS